MSAKTFFIENLSDMKSAYIALFLMLFVGCTDRGDPKQAFEKGDYERAFDLWRPLAEQGDQDAQNYLGIHYYLGLGTARNYALAKQWYMRAAENGHADAQRNLGLIYEAGHGAERDFEKAFIWLYAAHRQGHPRAGATLERLVVKLSPNMKLKLRKEARQYIFNDVLDLEAREY